jgi:quercetin dioxygenase-like cupin family protein
VEYVIDPESIEVWKIHQGVTATIAAEGQKMTGMLSYWEPGSLFGAHTHPHEQIGICLEGEGILTIDGRDYPVKKGQVYLIPSNLPHGERNEGRSRAVFFECFAPVREDLVERHRFEMPMVK